MSKVLESFYKMRDSLIAEGYNYPECLQTMYKVEKNLLALEILKTRVVDMHDLLVYEYSSFNQRRTLRGLTPISKEDYDLLKEIINEFNR